jgi:hypothetical protein
MSAAETRCATIAGSKLAAADSETTHAGVVVAKADGGGTKKRAGEPAEK